MHPLMLLRTITKTVLLVAFATSFSACKNWRKRGQDGTGVGQIDRVNGSSLGGNGIDSPLPPRSDNAPSFPTTDRQRFAPVQFGFDSYVVDASEQGKISAVVSGLKSTNEQVIVAGFTDERGTAEYNRQLGERRAQAVRQSLIEKGLSGSRIQTVSFGAEMPADPSSNESAWAKNRRAEFGIPK